VCVREATLKLAVGFIAMCQSENLAMSEIISVKSWKIYTKDFLVVSWCSTRTIFLDLAISSDSEKCCMSEFAVVYY
jgi:hypothetical protein